MVFIKMFPSSKTQDRISALGLWLKKIAIQADVHPEKTYPKKVIYLL